MVALAFIGVTASVVGFILNVLTGDVGHAGFDVLLFAVNLTGLRYALREEKL
jgi:hypothetical protein